MSTEPRDETIELSGPQGDADGIVKIFDPLLVARWYLHMKHWRQHAEQELKNCEARIHNQRDHIYGLMRLKEELNTEVSRLTAENDVLMECINAANQNLVGRSRQIDVLTAELEEARKDAGRYRWLREATAHAKVDAIKNPEWPMPMMVVRPPLAMDAFIDAAMTKEKP